MLRFTVANSLSRDVFSLKIHFSFPGLGYRYWCHGVCQRVSRTRTKYQLGFYFSNETSRGPLLGRFHCSQAENAKLRSELQKTCQDDEGALLTDAGVAVGCAFLPE